LSPIEIKSWFIAATIFSIIVGFISSSIETNKKYGSVYISATMGAWGKIVMTLLPFGIYSIISMSSGGWDNIFQSPEIAMGAFLILLLSSNELGCALAVKRNYPMLRYKVSILSMWSLLWLCGALTSVILIYQADEIPTVVIVWQFILLVVSIATYFGTGVVVRLVEDGYTAKNALTRQ
jgi:hypothetical protein